MTRVDYSALKVIVASLVDDVPDEVARMATLACEVYHADDRFDWVGFYRMTAPETLTIGPYQGGHGCLTIPFARGVCGAAARTRQVQLVPDVEAFPGHIACASSTRSELVLPVFGPEGEVIGVFDLDSDLPDAFTDEDASELTGILEATFSQRG